MKNLCCEIAAWTLLFFIVSCSRKNPPTTVVMDNWWMYDYVKNACESAEQNVKFDSSIETCVAGYRVYAADFETELNTAIASEEDCQGIEFIGFHPDGANVVKVSEAEDKPHWFLIVDLYQPTKMRGDWNLSFDDRKSKSGDGPSFKEDFDRDLHTVARHICRVVKSKGGKRV